MGVGLYSVSCGFGCGCGFGGFTSLIAMVLALRAREALRSGLGGQGVFGALTALRRSFGAPVSVSSARDRQRRSAASRTEMPRRTPCVPCNTFPPIPQLRLVQGRRNAALWASLRI